MTKLAASHARRKRKVAYSYFFVHDGIGERVRALSHSPHKDADALLKFKFFHIFAHADQRSVKTERNLAAIRR